MINTGLGLDASPQMDETDDSAKKKSRKRKSDSDSAPKAKKSKDSKAARPAAVYKLRQRVAYNEIKKVSVNKRKDKKFTAKRDILIGDLKEHLTSLKSHFFHNATMPRSTDSLSYAICEVFLAFVGREKMLLQHAWKVTKLRLYSGRTPPKKSKNFGKYSPTLLALLAHIKTEFENEKKAYGISKFLTSNWMRTKWNGYLATLPEDQANPLQLPYVSYAELGTKSDWSAVNVTCFALLRGYVAPQNWQQLYNFVKSQNIETIRAQEIKPAKLLQVLTPELKAVPVPEERKQSAAENEVKEVEKKRASMDVDVKDEDFDEEQKDLNRIKAQLAQLKKNFFNNGSTKTTSPVEKVIRGAIFLDLVGGEEAVKVRNLATYISNILLGIANGAEQSKSKQKSLLDTDGSTKPLDEKQQKLFDAIVKEYRAKPPKKADLQTWLRATWERLSGELNLNFPFPFAGYTGVFTKKVADKETVDRIAKLQIDVTCLALYWLGEEVTPDRARELRDYVQRETNRETLKKWEKTPKILVEKFFGEPKVKVEPMQLEEKKGEATLGSAANPLLSLNSSSQSSASTSTASTPQSLPGAFMFARRSFTNASSSFTGILKMLSSQPSSSPQQQRSDASQTSATSSTSTSNTSSASLMAGAKTKSAVFTPIKQHADKGDSHAMVDEPDAEKGGESRDAMVCDEQPDARPVPDAAPLR